MSKKWDVEHWKILASNGDLISPPFIASFSSNPDSLPMWSTYADKGNGVAIGISKVDFNTYKSKTGKPTWGKCCYNSKVYADKMKKLIANIYQDIKVTNDNHLRIGEIADNQLSKYFSILKNEHYAYEDEYRLIKTCSANDADAEVDFKEVGGILKPYYNFVLPKESLIEIRLGPCQNKVLSKKYLEKYLERVGYYLFESVKHVKVITSEIPFRII